MVQIRVRVRVRVRVRERVRVRLGKHGALYTSETFAFTVYLMRYTCCGMADILAANACTAGSLTGPIRVSACARK